MLFRLTSSAGFPSSVTKPFYKSCCLYTERQHRQYISQVTPVLVPGQTKEPGFLSLVTLNFDTSSAVYFRSALIKTPEVFLSPLLFPCPLNTSHVVGKHRRVVWQMLLLAPAGGSILLLFDSSWFSVRLLFIYNNSFLSFLIHFVCSPPS